MLRLTPCERERCFYWCLAKHSSCDAPAGVSIVGQDIEKFCGGFQRGTGVPLCVVAGGGFLRGRGSRNTLPLECPFGYFSDKRKVTRGPGAEPPQDFGKKHVSFPPDRRRANLSPSVPCAGTGEAKTGSGGETPAHSMGNLTRRCSASASARASTSSRVVSGPKLTRTVPAAVRLSRPMAVRTWLALPRWQAEPAEIKIPLASRSETMFWLG